MRRFIESHIPFSDTILVADGGSTDATAFICSQYPQVKFRYFGEYIQHEDGTFRNPEGKHMNFLIQWAEDEKADWIVQDDADHEPTSLLIENIRHIMETTSKGSIHALLMYVYKEFWYFPKLNEHENPTHLWTWKPSVNRIRCVETNTTSPEYEFFIPHSQSEVLPHPPYVRLHHCWINDTQIFKKIQRYNNYYSYGEDHPLKRCGRLERIPDWVLDTALSSEDKRRL